MKKIILLFFLFIALILPQPAHAQHVANASCLGIYGTFTATNWPGGTLDVACGGDTGSGGCVGQVTTLSPGQSFDFGSCTCFPFSDGCLKVGKDLSITQLDNGNRPVTGDFSLPDGCSLSSSLACGVNGNVVVGSFNVVCQVPKFKVTAIAHLDRNENCIIDGSNPIIPGVRFRLEDSKNASCITGTNGSCTVSDLLAGHYLQTLYPIPDGYRMSACNDTTRSFDLGPDKTFNYFLVPAPSPTTTPTPTPPPPGVPTFTPTPTPTPPACVPPTQVQNVRISCPTCTP